MTSETGNKQNLRYKLHHSSTAAYRKFFICLLLVILIGAISMCIFELWTRIRVNQINSKIPQPPDNVLLKNRPNTSNSKITKSACRHHSCFDVYPCFPNDYGKINVYIYPDVTGSNAFSYKQSHQFKELINGIRSSVYITHNPEQACVFIPPLDFLNGELIGNKNAQQLLRQLSHWNEGKNHLIFNMLPPSDPNADIIDIGLAVLAGGGLTDDTYRNTFDISIPVYSLQTGEVISPNENKPYLLISSELYLETHIREYLETINRNDLLLLDACDPVTPDNRCSNGAVHPYPRILSQGEFCLVTFSYGISPVELSDCLSQSSIPVIIRNDWVLPYTPLLLWQSAAVLLPEQLLQDLFPILQRYSVAQKAAMRLEGAHLWRSYISSMSRIGLTTLDIINDRVFPHNARSLESWNNPDFLPTLSPSYMTPLLGTDNGFTAVILTFDRFSSLVQVMKRIDEVPSLAKIVVVWNNVNKLPPDANLWPDLSVPLKVILSSENKLSNRFFPYPAIETQCVLAMDDDITMLNVDELEFAYQVWRELPDRIVGFPGRLHSWDNTTRSWRYDSEWLNDISMVLTGAAFYHNHYNHLYTHVMPPVIKNWIDDNINCEDIAMNFLVYNTTRKAPIKVTPRKKFKCPECVNVELLSADETHMVVRSACIDHFQSEFGWMPLQPVSFRADPALYKIDVPQSLQRFKDIGNL